MRALYPPLLLGLALLASCTSATQKQGLYEITEFYGGQARLTEGHGSGAGASQPPGHYLALTLASPGLARHYDSLAIPASNCAYLLFNNLTPPERQDLDYCQVTLLDSGQTRTYTFGRAPLQQTLQAVADLRTLVFNMQGHDYLAAANNLNPAALGATRPDSLPGIMHRLGDELNPLISYKIHGFSQVRDSASGLPLVRLYVVVPREGQPPRLLLADVNPALRANQRFLYGLRLAR